MGLRNQRFLLILLAIGVLCFVAGLVSRDVYRIGNSVLPPIWDNAFNKDWPTGFTPVTIAASEQRAYRALEAQR